MSRPTGLWLLWLLTGCQASTSVAPPEDTSGVVATFRDGHVTRAQVDQAVLRRPPAARTVPRSGRGDWYAEIVEEIVVERLLLAEAEGHSEDPQLRRLLEGVGRRARADRLLRARLPPLPAPTEEQLRVFYDAHLTDYHQPARRLVFNIFFRGPPSAARAAAEDARRRALAGEDFEALAAQLSASETRHDRGALGWLVADALPPDLAVRIFALPVGIPSEPVMSADGAHLFLVRDAVRERRYSFEEARPRAAARWLAKRQVAARDQLLAEVRRPPGCVVASREAFETIASAGDPEALLLRVGDRRLTLRELRRRVAERAWRGESLSELAWPTLQTIALEELLLQDVTSPPEAEDVRVAEVRRQVMITWARDQALTERAARLPQRLERFYRDNRARFSSPLLLAVERLRVPIGPEPVATMARLEAIAAGAPQPLERVARNLGGEVELLDRRTLVELTREAPRLARFCVDRGVGELTPPFRSGDALWLGRVTERVEPVVQPYEDVRPRVISALLQVHGRELYEELRAELLAGARIELFRERLMP